MWICLWCFADLSVEVDHKRLSVPRPQWGAAADQAHVEGERARLSAHPDMREARRETLKMYGISDETLDTIDRRGSAQAKAGPRRDARDDVDKK